MNYMQIDILCIGKLKDKYLESRCREYLKWLSPYAKIRLTELADSDKAGENTAILKHLEKTEGSIIVLSEDGRNFTSQVFAAKLGELSNFGRMTFVVGGPEGLLPCVKQRGTMLWALSPLTFTHEIARFLLCEQLFRAVSILRGGHYHNA